MEKEIKESWLLVLEHFDMLQLQPKIHFYGLLSAALLKEAFMHLEIRIDV